MSDAQLSFRKSANIDRVTDKRKDSLFRLVDTDGSGTIDAQEFAVLYDAIKKDLAEELEKEAVLAKEASSAKRRFKMLLLFVAVLVSFLAASVAANFAVIFTVVDQAITTTTTSTGLLEVKGSDVIAKTAPATQDVPLVVAPALDLDTLGTTKSLKVKYQEKDHDDGIIEAQFSIVAVRKHNNTFVEFVTDVEGEVIEVLNGGAYLTRFPTKQNGFDIPQTYEICSANATCSAFRASGIDVDAALDLAKTQLAEAGFEARARQLSPDFGTCFSGSWTTKVQCGWKWTSGYNFAWQGYCYGQDLDDITTITSGATISWDWDANPNAPPANLAAAGLTLLYWSGWGAMKHIVFFAHGKYGYVWSMWDYYCTPQSALCPALTINDFKHLVFAFGGSGVVDAGTSAYAGSHGWSTDVDDSSAYATTANVLSSKLANEVKSGIYALNCRSTCIRRCVYTPTGLSGMSGFNTYTYSRSSCYWSCASQCPFNHRTEMMIIGYSDGGGLAMYMGYHSSMVSKSVSIDFWAGNAYESWLGTSSQVNAVIYTACGSMIFDDGPEAILPDSTPTGNTYVSGAGLTAGGIPSAYASFGAGCPAGEDGDWWPFTWASGVKSITMNIHGLGSAPSSLGASDSSQWTTSSGLGTLCTADGWIPYGMEPHHHIMYYIDVAMEVGSWLGLSMRRQLDETSATEPQLLSEEQRQLYTSKTYLKDEATEALISSKPYGVASYGFFTKAMYSYPRSVKAAVHKKFAKAAPVEKTAMSFGPGNVPPVTKMMKKK